MTSSVAECQQLLNVYFILFLYVIVYHEMLWDKLNAIERGVFDPIVSLNEIAHSTVKNHI